MTIVRIIFALAAIWGFLALVPGFFGEASFNAEMPPAITHPEFYYGFYGVALVFQLIFVMIAIDPVRYRPLIGIAILEKLAFFLPGMLLFSQGRLAEGGIYFGAVIDGIWAVLFALAWWFARREGLRNWPANKDEGKAS